MTAWLKNSEAQKNRKIAAVSKVKDPRCENFERKQKSKNSEVEETTEVIQNVE